MLSGMLLGMLLEIRFLVVLSLSPNSFFIAGQGADVGACEVRAGEGACIFGAGVGACVARAGVGAIAW